MSLYLHEIIFGYFPIIVQIIDLEGNCKVKNNTKLSANQSFDLIFKHHLYHKCLIKLLQQHNVERVSSLLNYVQSQRALLGKTFTQIESL